MRKTIVLFLLLLLMSPATFVAAIGEDLSALPGSLVTIGADYNVYTFNFSENSEAQLTTDASNSRRYQWPTWSNDGRLAYFCCDLARTRDLLGQAFISPDGVQAGEVIYEGEGTSVIYAYWSPSNCTDGDNCRDLALLVNDVMRGGLSVEMVRNRTENTTIERVGVGSPFYYHWNAAGSQLIFHRNNRSVDIYDMAVGDVTANLEARSSGAYQTPAWSPVDDRVLFGVVGEEARTTDLVVSADGEARSLVTGLPGLVSFLWSPDGRYLAYRTLTNDGASPLVVVDIETGTVVGRTLNVGILAFFWSPDSRKLAFLTIGGSGSQAVRVNDVPQQAQQPVQDLPTIVWSVFDVETNAETDLAAFSPTYEMGYLLQYFDQFAPSHRVWSPDSSHLVYSALEIDGDRLRPSVNILDVENASTTTVADGVFGIWSFE